MTDRLPPWAGLKRCRSAAGNVLAKTLRLTLTLSQDVDLNGDVDVDSTLDLVRGPSGGLRILPEESRPMVNVEVDDGLDVHGHVNLDDGRQGQGSGQRQPGDAPEAGLVALARRVLRDGLQRDAWLPSAGHGPSMGPRGASARGELLAGVASSVGGCA